MNDLNTIQIEQALLGAFMLNNDMFPRISNLRQEHFFEPIHGKIYTIMRGIVEQGGTANPLTLTPYIKDDLASLGVDGKFLFSIAKNGGRVVDAKDYAWSIIDTYQRREMMAVIDRARDEISTFDLSNPTEKIAATVMGDVEKILHEKPSKGQSNREVGQEIIRDLSADFRVYSTGYPRLDEAMGGGIYEGMTYGFGGRKKTGKTIFASSVSYQLNRAGVKHLFIAAEMGSKQIEQRNIARGLNEFQSAFRLKRNDRDFEKRVAQFVHDNPANVIYHNVPGITLPKLKEIVYRAVSDNAIKGVILDYWQLVGGKPNGKSTAEHQDEVAQWIADFGRESGLWSIVMAQINQEGNTRGGEGLRLACDQFYQINRDDITKPEMWLEMMETRYTRWTNVGEGKSEGNANPRAGYTLVETGPWYREE